jgi:hypothetical protein
MKITGLLLTLLGLIVSSGWRVADDEISLHWEAARPLIWSDFRGEPDALSDADAASAIRISAKPYRKGRKIFYAVDATFLPGRSWCRSKSDRLLRHEQLHFDIAELYARKIRKKVNDLRLNGIHDLKKYQDAVNLLLEESNRVDVTYDTRTCHGVITDKQLMWEKNIGSQLRSLEMFSTDSVTKL